MKIMNIDQNQSVEEKIKQVKREGKTPRDSLTNVRYYNAFQRPCEPQSMNNKLKPFRKILSYTHNKTPEYINEKEEQINQLSISSKKLYTKMNRKPPRVGWTRRYGNKNEITLASILTQNES